MRKEQKAIITVVGKDEVGIVANIATMLAQNNINILEISQTTLQGIFTMTMLVDLQKSELTIAQLSDTLKKISKKIHQNIHVYDERIITAMHRI